ncbi:MAG: ATP-binding protein, partial [Ferruginibacter sp.]
NNNQVFLINPVSLTANPVNLITTDKKLLNFNTGASQLFWQTGMMQPIIINSNNAWSLNYSGNTITATLITSVIPKDANISSVEYTEKNRLLFIGTESKGIIIINQNLVQPKKRKNANPKNKNAYFSQLALDNGNILTNEGDIIGNSNSNPGKLPINGKFATRITLTDNGNLIWYNATDARLGFNCLHQYNKTNGQTIVFDKIKINTQVEISAGKTYLANNKGIGTLQGDSINYLFEYPKGIPNLNTYDFKEISPGILAVAGCSGLLRFTTATNTLDTIYSRENACFGSIWKYKEYIFWGSYGFGYYVYKNGVIKEMPVDKNDYLLYCHCFVPDPYGFCWISTNRGLFKVELDQIIAHFENSTTPVYYHYFGKKDGIEMTELNGGCTPCALTLKDQTISFPTMDGLLWVNPITAKPVLPTGEIYIDEVLIDNKDANPDSLKQITLAATTQEMIFKLGFSGWCNKENLYIDYQLNDTAKWKKLKAEDNASIQFNNLPAGKYILRIRKLNGFGINNYSYKTIEFSIAKRWYNEWWFYLLMLGLMIGLVVLFGKIRSRQFKLRQKKLEIQVAEKTQELLQKNEVLEKNDTIKTRLISIISHDIVTPLKFVTVAGKNLIEKRTLMSEELQQETIQEITNTSQELQLLSTNILNWIKYQNENRRLAKENFNLYEMTDQVLGVLYSLAKQKKLILVNTIDKDLQIYQYFEPLKILVYNLLTNAINFSEKGRIIIAAQPADDKLIISVTDEGVGMTADQIKNIMADQFIVSSANIDNRKGNGLGYLIIKDLIKTMDAKLHISSEKGIGTTVSIEMSITKN